MPKRRIIRKKVETSKGLEVKRRPIEEYRDGGKGFIKWCEDKVWIPVTPEGSTIELWTPIHSLPEDKNPKTGRSYKDMWESAKEIVAEALRMENGEFIYTLIVFCWMRGEGKSLDVCLIQLWKFFCFERQSCDGGPCLLIWIALYYKPYFGKFRA